VTEAAERPVHCRNCGAAAPGKYCPACGQETRLALPTVREMMRDAAGHLVAFDSRLWRTLYYLLFRPGLLTIEYLRGRRKHYVRPARLFFVTAILLFAVIRLADTAPTITDDVNVDLHKPPSNAKPPAPGPGAPGGQASTPPRPAVVHIDDEDIKWLDDVSKQLPGELHRRIDRFRHLSLEDKAEQVYSGVLRFGPYAMVVLLPAFALLQMLSYLPGRRRHPQRPSRYAEHLVYGAHLHAFAFLMISAIVLAPVVIVRFALALWIVVYVGRARIRMYGGTWLGGLFRILGMALVYTTMLALTMAALIMVAIVLR
jgi:Protein of unknown function (DUF3667)